MTTNQKKRVLFVCTGNSARSQMAEGLLRRLGGDSYEVSSAGTFPTSLHPLAAAVMKEIGIDVSHHYSKSFDQFVTQPFDYVITVCDRARESCPVFHGARHQLHWSFEDPADAEGTEDQRKKVFRDIRDQIQTKVKSFLNTSR